MNEFKTWSQALEPWFKIMNEKRDHWMNQVKESISYQTLKTEKEFVFSGKINDKQINFKVDLPLSMESTWTASWKDGDQMIEKKGCLGQDVRSWDIPQELKPLVERFKNMMESWIEKPTSEESKDKSSQEESKCDGQIKNDDDGKNMQVQEKTNEVIKKEDALASGPVIQEDENLTTYQIERKNEKTLEFRGQLMAQWRVEKKWNALDVKLFKTQGGNWVLIEKEKPWGLREWKTHVFKNENELIDHVETYLGGASADWLVKRMGWANQWIEKID